MTNYSKKILFASGAAIALCFATPPLLAEYPEVLSITDSSITTSLDSKIDDESGWWATTAIADPTNPPGELATPGSDWRKVPMPSNFVDDLNLPDGRNIVWYMRRFELNTRSERPMALHLGIINDRDRTYLNGVRIGATGDWTAVKPQAYDRERIYVIPEGVLNRQGTNVLMIQVYGAFPHEGGIPRSHTSIGPADELLSSHYIKNFIDILFLVCYLTVGGYFLFLFLRRRAERENFYFGMFSLGLVLYQFLRTQIKYEFDIDFFFMKRVEWLALAFIPHFFYRFIRNYFDLPRRLWIHVFDAAMFLPIVSGVILGGFILWTDDVTIWDEVNNQIFIPSIMIFYVFGLLSITFGVGLLPLLVRVGKRIWNLFSRGSALSISEPGSQERDAKLMLIGMCVFVVGMLVDLLSHQGVINVGRILQYVFLAIILMLALILANRFVRLNEEVEDLNRNLERKVEERTEELNKTLANVRKLKERQDGDYFLTSLLIKPLGGNFANSELVSVQIAEEQKKKFHFRGRDAEIGGDLNVVHEIRLRERKYVCFLNGDAMGKSIQGAGGALVLGTVFKSILVRTARSRSLRRLPPEIWLKQCYAELQDVFVSFDGSMLISIVLGLVDESNGMVYYVNAEHPWVCLYRNGTASFLQEDTQLLKVGVDMDGQQLKVDTFRMLPGDVLFSGSDGRDDIVLGQDDNGRVMNEDHTRFLRSIETSRGELQRLVAYLKSQGELSDDLSLIRIGFREDSPMPVDSAHEKIQALLSEAKLQPPAKKGAAIAKALELSPTNELALHAQAIHLREQKDYLEAGNAYLAYHEQVPEAMAALADARQCLFEAGELHRAAECGERLRVLAPDDRENTLQLAEIYSRVNKPERARRLRQIAESGEPDTESWQEAIGMPEQA